MKGYSEKSFEMFLEDNFLEQSMQNLLEKILKNCWKDSMKDAVKGIKNKKTCKRKKTLKDFSKNSSHNF